MAKIYAKLIRKGLKTINDVPEKLKAAVREILEKNGFEELAAETEPMEEAPELAERTEPVEEAPATEEETVVEPVE